MDNEYGFEITSVVLEKQRTKAIFKRVLEILISQKVETVEVTYGFAWGNEIYESVWLPIQEKPSQIEDLVEVEARKGTGEIGSDDFYVELKDRAIRIQFCPENDVHIEYNVESEFLEKLKTSIRPEEWAWKKRKGQKDWEKLTP